MKTAVGNRIVEIASQFIDLVEIYQNRSWKDASKSGENRESKLISALSSVGWNPGDAYCMSFARYCFEKAHKDLDLSKNDNFKIIKKCLSNSVVSSFNNLQKEGLTQEVPIVGSIFFLQKQRDAARGHAGIVINFDNEYFETIEGNTTQHNRTNSVELEVEGDGVYRKRRSFEKSRKSNSLRLLGFLHPAFATTQLSSKDLEDGPEFTKKIFREDQVVTDLPPEIIKNIPMWLRTFESKILTFNQMINS